MKSIVILVLTAAFTGFVHGQTTPAPAKPTPTPPAAPSKRGSITYDPPKNATPGTRNDGDAGTRAGNVKLPALYVLTPDHTALTTREQPSLFWFQSDKAATRFELTLIEPRKAKALLRLSMDQVERGGIHRVALARHGIKLTPGVTYKWSIALVPDPANRSQDVIASGTIQRMTPSEKLTADLATAASGEKAAIYARHGIWYDSLEEISDQILAAPNDNALRRLRASLLNQAGLKAAAESDSR